MKGRTITGVVLMAATLFYLMVSMFVLQQEGTLNLVNEMRENLMVYREEEGLKLQVSDKNLYILLEEKFHNSSLEKTCNLIAEKFFKVSDAEEVNDKDFTYYIVERKKEREFIKKYSVTGRISYTK